MDYMWLKLPIYIILFCKTMAISKVHAELKEADDLTPGDDFRLMAFMMLYGCVFLVLLLS